MAGVEGRVASAPLPKPVLPVAVQVDGGTPLTVDLAKAAEDVLVRVPIAALPAGAGG